MCIRDRCATPCLVQAAGAPSVPALSAVQQAEIDRLMHPYDGDVPGASLLVLKDGQAVVRQGYGRSDLELSLIHI